MNFLKRFIKVALAVSSVAVFSISMSHVEVNLVAHAATTQEDQTVDQMMPNEKLRELVLVNMKKQQIITDPNFTVADFTPASFKADLGQLTYLGWEIGTAAEVDNQVPVNGGNGSVGPTNKGNYSLEGLQYCHNLTKIELNSDLNRGKHFFRNDIIDISPLKGLTNLEYVNLSGNRIQDISPLAGLTKIKTLYINTNCITNLNTLDASQYTAFNYLGQIVIFPLKVLHTDTYTWKAPFVDSLPKNAVTSEAKLFQPYQREFLTPGTRAYGNPVDASYSQIDVFRNGTFLKDAQMGKTTISGDDFTYTNLSPQVSPADPENPFTSVNATVVSNPYTYYMIAQYRFYKDPTNPQPVLSYFMPYDIQEAKAQPVTVQYVDSNGNKLHDPATITGNIDESFDLSKAQYKLTIPGYTFQKYDPAQIGTISDKEQTFKLVYTKNASPVIPTPPTTPTTPETPEQPTNPSKPTPPTENQQPDYATTTGEVVYSLKKIYLYKNPTFKKSERITSYAKKPRVFRPMFVVTDYQRSSQGRLRYKVRDVNHESKTAGKTGYITTKSTYVSPVYYESKPKFVTVISPNGVNEYNEKNLTEKVTTFKQGTVLKVASITTHNLTTRYMLGNGNFITANRKLVMNGKQKQPKRVVVKRAINRYNNANFSKKNGHFKKGDKLAINFYTYSHATSHSKSGAKRFAVKGGYITANAKFVKVYK